MTSFPFRPWLLGLVLFSSGLVTGLIAQTPNETTQRVERDRVDLSGAPGMEVVVSTGEYKPGECLRLHTHHGIEAAYVMQGAKVQSPGQAPKRLSTGTSLLNLRGAEHGGFTVVGDVSLKVTVHIVDKDKPLYDYTQ